MTLAFDSLAYARKLREAGFSEQQAQASAEALAAAMTDTLASRQDLEALATRQDLRDLAAHVDLRFERVDARFAQVEARFVQMDARIDGLERRMDERFEAAERRTDERFAEMDRHIGLRLSEHSAHNQASLADLERRMTMRLGGITVAGIGIVSALVKML